MKARIYAFLEVLFIAIFVFACYKLVGIYLNYNEGDKIYEESQDTYFEASDDKDDDTFTLNIAELQAANKDALGWIYIEDTPVSYPILQTDNNDYYLKHTYNRKYSDFGSIFIDHRCSGDLTDSHTIIYGHNTKNGSMFGSLKKYKDATYLKKHPYIYLIMADKTYKYKIVSAYTTETSDDIYTLDFSNKTQFSSWLKKVITSTDVEGPQVDVKGDEKVITLSTCTSRTETERFVVSAVLIDTQENGGSAVINK